MCNTTGCGSGHSPLAQPAFAVTALANGKPGLQPPRPLGRFVGAENVSGNGKMTCVRFLDERS